MINYIIFLENYRKYIWTKSSLRKLRIPSKQSKLQVNKILTDRSQIP